MLKMFKSKRAEVRVPFPAYTFRESIDEIVNELRGLVSKIKGLEIVGDPHEVTVLYKSPRDNAKRIIFGLHRVPQYINGLMVNIVQYNDAIPEVEQAVLRVRTSNELYVR